MCALYAFACCFFTLFYIIISNSVNLLICYPVAGGTKGSFKKNINKIKNEYLKKSKEKSKTENEKKMIKKYI